MATLSQPFSTDPNQQQGQGQTTSLSTGTTTDPTQPNAGGSNTSTAPQLQSGVGGASITPGSSSGGAPSSSPKGTTSGSYTNLQKYMTANQNFAQDQGGLAGQMVSNINQYRPDVQGAQQAFNQAYQPMAQQFQNAPNSVQQAIANPTAAVQDQNLFNQVAAARDATYTGPKSLSDLDGKNNFNTLQAQSNNYSSLANAGQSEAGRYDLLHQMFNRPNYTTGQQSLDNLLIQSDQGQLQKLQNQRQSAAQANQQLQSAQQYTSSIGQNMVDQANTLKQNTRNAFNNAMSGVNQDLQSQVQAGKEYNTNLMNDVASGKLTADQAKRLGLDGSVDTYGVDATKYLNLEDPTAQTVATPEQYARYAALAKLDNTNNALLADPTQAGQFNSYKPLDVSTMMNDINAAKTAYTNQYGGLQGQYNHDQLDYNIKAQQQINAAADQMMQNLGVSKDFNGNLTYTGGSDNNDPLSSQQAGQQAIDKYNQLQSYIKNISTPGISVAQESGGVGGSGWDAYNNWLDQHSGDASKFAPNMTAAQADALLGQGNSVTNFLNNDGLAGSMSSLQAKMAALNQQYGIGKGLKVES